MTKKKQLPKRDPVLDTERTIRNAIGTVPGLVTLPEERYVEIVLGALDLITEGLKMRQQELQQEQEGD